MVLCTWGKLVANSSRSQRRLPRCHADACTRSPVRIIPVILSGGAGTRLWPLSRETAPKPSMPLPDGETLLAKTAARALALPGVARLRHRHQPRVLLPHEGRVRRRCATGCRRTHVVPARAVRPQHGTCCRARRALGAAATRRRCRAARASGRSPRFAITQRSSAAVARASTPCAERARSSRSASLRRIPRRASATSSAARADAGDGAARVHGACASSRSRRSPRRANTSSPATTSGTPECSASRRRRSSRRSSVMRPPCSTRCVPSCALAGKQRRVDARDRRQALRRRARHLARLRGDGEGRGAKARSPSCAARSTGATSARGRRWPICAEPDARRQPRTGRARHDRNARHLRARGRSRRRDGRRREPGDRRHARRRARRAPRSPAAREGRRRRAEGARPRVVSSAQDGRAAVGRLHGARGGARDSRSSGSR